MAESITKAFKRASGLADFLEKQLNLQLRAHRRILGPKYKPPQKFLYYAMPNGKAASVAGFNPSNEKLKKLEHDDVACRFGADDRWRCWAVKHSPPHYVIVFLFDYCIVWDAANNKMAANVTLNVAQGGGPATLPCLYSYITQWINEKTQAEVIENIWNTTNYGMGGSLVPNQVGNQSGSNAYSSYSCVATYFYQDQTSPPLPEEDLLLWECTESALYANKSIATKNVTMNNDLTVPQMNSYSSFRLTPQSGVGPALWRAVSNSGSYKRRSYNYVWSIGPPLWEAQRIEEERKAEGLIVFHRPLQSSRGSSVSWEWAYWVQTIEETTWSTNTPTDTIAFVCDLFCGIRSKDTGLHVAIDILGLAHDSGTYVFPSGVRTGWSTLDPSKINSGDVTPGIAAICEAGTLTDAPPTKQNAAFISALTQLFNATVTAGTARWISNYASAPAYPSSSIRIYIRKPKP